MPKNGTNMVHDFRQLNQINTDIIMIDTFVYENIHLHTLIPKKMLDFLLLQAYNGSEYVYI